MWTVSKIVGILHAISQVSIKALIQYEHHSILGMFQVLRGSHRFHETKKFKKHDNQNKETKIVKEKQQQQRQ